MKALSRRLKRYFGVTAQHVAVRSQHPWYWQLVIFAALISVGYLLCYWQLFAGNSADIRGELQHLRQENSALRGKIVYSERQLQVERAAQNTLAKELTGLQDDDMRLKEELAFYKSVLAENSGTGVLKLHSFKLSKGAQPNQYDYHILLLQSGRHDKTVQGGLKLLLEATQSGKPVTLPVVSAAGPQALKVNFKYYQRLDGSFIVPDDAVGHAIEASFIENGANQPKISQKVDLPD